MPALCLRALAVALLLAACGGGAGVVPLRPAALPLERVPRDAALDAFGRRMFGAVRGAEPAALLFDDTALRSLLLPEAASRAASARLNVPGARLEPGVLFAETDYQGICIQGGRQEPRGGGLGLAAPGWVFDRALVVALEPGGGPVAAWVEGEFLHTSRGFGALSIRRLEAPRRDHSDLELAVCDLAVGLTVPQGVVVGGGPHH